MARLYSNENFPLPVVAGLRALGHDIATIQERGRANEAAPDSDVLALALSEDRAVLTLNRKDFYKLHERNSSHAGIIVCVADLDFPRLVSAIHERIEAEGNLQGRIIRVPPRV